MAVLEPVYRERLGDIPGVLSHRIVEPPPVRDGKRFDAGLILRTTSGGALRLLVQQSRSHLGREMASHRAFSLQGSEPVLLLAPHVGSGVAATLINAGINYLDASGNCHISAPPFYVHVEGKNAARIPDVSAGIRAPGYQVLFSYLAEPALLGTPLRAVAERAGVSRQPVMAMRHRLVAEGYVLESSSRTRWHPQRREDALGLWLHGYQTTVRASLIIGTYRTREKTPAELEAWIESSSGGRNDQFKWGGTAAAFLLTGTYRGERTVVHVRTEANDVSPGRKMLADPHGNLIVMRSFGLINWSPERDTVHPLLVYSEMLSDGNERARESAQELHERYLLPLWTEQR